MAVRLFVALEIPDALRQRLGGLCAGLRGARWVPPENMHVTLRFIGEIEEGLARELALELAEIEAPAFDLRLTGLGMFGQGRRSKGLWVGAERIPPLMFLRDKVESTLVRAGLEPEHRKFAPHLTLARLRDVSPARLQVFLAAHEPFQTEPFAVSRFVLFSSLLGHGDPVYRAEAVYPLDEKRAIVAVPPLHADH